MFRAISTGVVFLLLLTIMVEDPCFSQSQAQPDPLERARALHRQFLLIPHLIPPVFPPPLLLFPCAASIECPISSDCRTDRGRPGPLDDIFVLYRQPQSGNNRYDAYALPFDLSQRKVTGPEVPVLEDIRYGQFAVSATGTLAYNSSGADETMTQLIWVGLNGWWQSDSAWGRSYDIESDGKRFVMIIRTSTAGSEITAVLNWFEELKRKLQGK